MKGTEISARHKEQGLAGRKADRHLQESCRSRSSPILGATAFCLSPERTTHRMSRDWRARTFNNERIRVCRKYNDRVGFGKEACISVDKQRLRLLGEQMIAGQFISGNIGNSTDMAFGSCRIKIVGTFD